jgi:curved DNA-binding protein CbpA
MNLNSRLFDRIRIAADEPDANVAAEAPACDHRGCRAAGEFRAPKGRGREGQYFRFCFEHVKEYNATYNYFSGMSDDAVAAYQKEAVVGHRPTWKLGVNARNARKSAQEGAPQGPRRDDPFEFFAEQAAAGRNAPPQEAKLGNAARAALDKLGLDATADRPAVKARYKELVKRLHPDANGGDRSREERLAEIIKAYNYLKSIGRA